MFFLVLSSWLTAKCLTSESPPKITVQYFSARVPIKDATINSDIKIINKLNSAKSDSNLLAANANHALSLSPTTLAEQRISITNYVTGNVNQFYFASDQTFHVSGFLNAKGTFNFVLNRSAVGLAQLNFIVGDLAGNNGTLQLDYASDAVGKYRLEVFDRDQNLLGSSQGKFNQQ